MSRMLQTTREISLFRSKSGLPLTSRNFPVFSFRVSVTDFLVSSTFSAVERSNMPSATRSRMFRPMMSSRFSPVMRSYTWLTKITVCCCP
jgi:hypothetical protein